MGVLRSGWWALLVLAACMGCDDADDADPGPVDGAVADAIVDAAPLADGAVVDARIEDAVVDAALPLDAAADAAIVDAGAEDARPGDALPADMAAAEPDYERDPAQVELRGPCPRAQRFGGFKVESNDGESYTAVDGVVKDSVVAGQVLEETLAEGGCALLTRRRLICEPSCDPGMTCDLGGQCVPIPRGQDMGAVDIRGLVQALTLEALQPGNTYFFTRLPHPGFIPNTVLHIANTPGFLGPLDMYGVGVAPLVVHQDAWVLTEGEALSITWDPPPDARHTRLYFELNIDQHGLSPANLVCSLPDTGRIDVPIAMTDALIAAGVTGYPTGRVARRTTDSSTFDGRCIDFVVSSVRAIDEIEVTGYIPCSFNEDCPSGRCNVEIEQCE